MTTNLTRRTALAAPVALLPGVAGGNVSLTRHLDVAANATEAAWAEYQAAKAKYSAIEAASTAFDEDLEARLPECLKLHTRPDIRDYEQYEDFRAAIKPWNTERAEYGVNPLAHDGGPVE